MLGAGFAGVSVAWHLLQVLIRITNWADLVCGVFTEHGLW